MPTSVRVLKNVDILVLLVALVVFLVTPLPELGWITGAAAWLVQRAISELAVRRSEAADDVRTRVGLLAGSIIIRGWVVAGILVAVGLNDSDAGLAAAVLFLAVFTLQLTMTMAIRPYDAPPPRAAATAKPRGGAAKP